MSNVLRVPLGYRPRSATDPHRGVSYKLSAEQASAEDRRGRVTLFDATTPTRGFQYSAGSCTGQAFAHAIEYVMRAAAKDGLLDVEPFKPSALAIYAWERALAGSFYDDIGARLIDGVQVLSERGIPREEDWPYDENRLFVHPDQRVDARAAENRLVSSRPLLHRLREFRHALLTDCPIVIGIPCYAGRGGILTARAAETAVIADPEPSDRVEGWHAVALEDHDPETRTFGILNSWPNFGDAGRARISEDYVLTLTNESYAIGAVR